jgi:hypothetical protein
MDTRVAWMHRLVISGHRLGIGHLEESKGQTPLTAVLAGRQNAHQIP